MREEAFYITISILIIIPLLIWSGVTLGVLCILSALLVLKD